MAAFQGAKGWLARCEIQRAEGARARPCSAEGDAPPWVTRNPLSPGRYRGFRRHNGALRPGQDRNRLNVPVREAVLVEDNELNRVGPRVRVIVRCGATVAHGPVSELPDVRRDYAVRVERIRPVEGDRLTGDRPGGAPSHDADRGLRQDHGIRKVREAGGVVGV